MATQISRTTVAQPIVGSAPPPATTTRTAYSRLLTQIPVPRAQIRYQIGAVAKLIGGRAEPLLRADEIAPVGLHLPMASVMVLGTACDRPLLLQECVGLANSLETSAIIVRQHGPANEASAIFSYDFYSGGRGSAAHPAGWLCNLYAWCDQSDRLWLVPAFGEGASVCFSAFALDTISRTPFYSHEEREAGFARAAAAFNRVREGQ